jgi:hypothetical protein
MSSMAGQRGREAQLKQLQQHIDKLSPEETKELLLLSMYKLAMVRAQLDALSDVLVKKKLLTREELWKLTARKFEESGF